MKQTLSQASYSTFSLEIEPGETRYRSVDEIIAYFRERIEEHRTARFIAEFDHYAHTRALPEGQIGEDILAAKLLIFCFGISLPDPAMLAVRPRSIGVAQTRQGFVITFLEPPMPVANAVMEDWAQSLCDPARPGMHPELPNPDEISVSGAG